MLGQVLRAVDTAVLPARAAKAEHQAGEAALDVAAHVMVGQLVDTIEELQYLAIVFQKADDGRIQSRELLVGLITTRVVGAAAIKHIATAIARRVFRYALAEGKAIDPYHQGAFAVILGIGSGAVLRVGGIDVLFGGLIAVEAIGGRLLYQGELRQFGESLQHFHQVRIGEHLLAHSQQIPQIPHGGGDAFQEVSLTFEIASKAVSAQHLQRAEEHEEAQPVDKMAHGRHFHVMLQRLIVFPNQLATQLEGIVGGSLPEERGQVVIERSLPATLKVYEIRIPSGVEHDVTRLEVPVHEAFHGLGSQVLGQETKVGFQLQLMEIQLRRLQETVLEIVEVEEHAVRVKLRLRIAVTPIQPAGASYLQVGQFTDNPRQECLLSLVVSASRLTSSLDSVKKRQTAKVCLQIAQFILAHRQYLGHRQLTQGEMIGQIHKGVVFLHARAQHAYHGRPVMPRQAIILAITALQGERSHLGRLLARPLGIEFQQPIHPRASPCAA